uniref:Uncharacterized protein n=1 Tax=Cacopsylla melanoneura TaxID=428564 RepID=A0A8D8YU18_9HEMI
MTHQTRWGESWTRETAALEVRFLPCLPSRSFCYEQGKQQPWRYLGSGREQLISCVSPCLIFSCLCRYLGSGREQLISCVSPCLLSNLLLFVQVLGVGTRTIDFLCVTLSTV